MERNESFPVSAVNALALRLTWASLDVMVDDVSDIQVMISGTDADVCRVKLRCEDGRLLLQQSAGGLPRLLNRRRQLQASLRLPPQWKGALDAGSISAPLKIAGVTGTDFRLRTVSGGIRAEGLSGITVALRTVSGEVTADNIAAEQLGLHSLTGDITVSGADVRRCRLSTVAGNTYAGMIVPFDRFDGTTVSGDVYIDTPVTEANALLRGASGRLRTSGVSIMENAPVIHVKSVSGNLEINHQDLFEEE